MKISGIIFAAFCFLGILANNSFAIADKDGPKIGDVPPPLTLTKTIQGSPAKEISWDKLKGKVAVSYTHLDVYKRQVSQQLRLLPQHLGAPGAGRQ